MRPLLASIAVSAAILALAACRTPPLETFYTLNPEPMTETANVSGNDAVFTVSVGPVHVPEMVDRPQLVVRRSPNRVDVLEQHRWAQPLPAEIARVLAADLAVRLPNARAVASGNVSGQGAEYRITLDIEQFDAVPGQGVTVLALWSVRRAGTTLRTGRSLLREPVRAEGYEALVAAYARALAKMSIDIAGALRSLPPPS